MAVTSVRCFQGQTQSNIIVLELPEQQVVEEAPKEIRRKKKHWEKVIIIDGKRECLACGKWLLLTEHFYFFQTKGRHGHYGSRCKQCIAESQSAEKRRDANLRINYGITLTQYNEMLEKQGGVCAACGREERTVSYGRLQPLSVDHCHTTGRIRGLLCNACNTALGLLDEELERIEALSQYIISKNT